MDLVSGFLGTFVLAIVSAWTLHKRDHEAKRLFEMDKFWRPLKEHEIEAMRFAKIRRRLVFGFSIFLVLNIAMCAFFAFEIARSLGWF
jgi:hypothetical protein